MEEHQAPRASTRFGTVGHVSRTFLCLLMPLLPIIPAAAQENNATVVDQSEKAMMEAILNSSTVSYKPESRKDPFFHIPPAPKNPNSSNNVDEEISRGLPPPGIAGTFIKDAVVEGIAIRSDRSTAIVRGADKRAYFLHEGDRLFDGYLRTIREDSIVLIRETRMRSGKTLTQEVIQRLRKP